VTFLLDTNVISELRKPQQRADRHVRAWAKAQHVLLLHISVITLLEIEIGIGRVERRDPQQGRLLREWLDERVIGAFQRRILPVDVPAAQRAAALHIPDPRPERDALMAGTALANDLVVVTRNESDFAPMGVAVVNPWRAPNSAV
jgi:toxin FitB